MIADKPGRTRSALEDAIGRLVDPRFGVIQMVSEMARSPGSPQFFQFYAEACHTERLGGQANFKGGGGASCGRDAALAKAVGEAIERYCAALYSPNDFPVAAYEAADFPCVDPGDFALYRADQYNSGRIEFVPFTRSLPVRWTPALDIETLSTTYVPAGMVFVPYKYNRSEGEHPIAQPISTGMACGEGYYGALVSAACEAVERDAFSIFWLAKLSPRQVRLDSLDEQNADRVARFRRARYDVTLFDITTDIVICTVMAVARHDDPTQPALVVASAAHPSATTAVRKCLDELELTRAWCKRLKATMPPITGADKVVTQEDHIRYWCDQSNLNSAEWLFAHKELTDLELVHPHAGDDAAETLAYVRRSLQAVGLKCYAVDLTSADVGDFGLRVVKTIIPGLQPLVMGHVKRALGGRRLYEVPAHLGYGTPELALDDDTNPHPFP